MLEKWLMTLAERKESLLVALAGLEADEATLDLARKEIDVNFVSARMYLTRLAKDNLPLNDDLTENVALYDKSDSTHYRCLFNHLESHLIKMERVIEHVRGKSFEPEFAQNY